MSLDAKQATRCDQLFKMGLIFNGSSYVGKGLLEDVDVPALDIQCLDDVRWERDITRKLQREIDRRNALPPLNFVTVYNRGGIMSSFLTRHGVLEGDTFVEYTLQESWRQRLFDAIEARRGAAFLIATHQMNTPAVHRLLQLNTDDPSMVGVKFILVNMEH
jgi:hypothetical protein